MGEVIGEILPLALVISLSPVVLIAAILVLLSPSARAAGATFLLGAIVAVALMVVVFTLLSNLLPHGDSSSGDSSGSGSSEANPVAGILRLLLGALLLFLAVRKWRSRPKNGEPDTLPGWMATLSEVAPGRALVLGFVVFIANPKNLAVSAAASLVISYGAPDDSALAIAVFVAIATLSVWMPLLAYLVAPRPVAVSLAGLRDWLVQNNATVMCVFLLLIASVVIGEGIASF